MPPIPGLNPPRIPADAHTVNPGVPVAAHLDARPGMDRPPPAQDFRDLTNPMRSQVVKLTGNGADSGPMAISGKAVLIRIINNTESDPRVAHQEWDFYFNDSTTPISLRTTGGAISFITDALSLIGTIGADAVAIQNDGAIESAGVSLLPLPSLFLSPFQFSSIRAVARYNGGTQSRCEITAWRDPIDCRWT